MEDNYIISMDGEFTDSLPANGKDYDLKELQEIVGGCIEIIELCDDMIMVINDDGKFTCEPNPCATALAKICGSIFPDDYIAGDVLVCHSELVK